MFLFFYHWENLLWKVWKWVVFEVSFLLFWLITDDTQSVFSKRLARDFTRFTLNSVCWYLFQKNGDPARRMRVMDWWWESNSQFSIYVINVKTNHRIRFIPPTVNYYDRFVAFQSLQLKSLYQRGFQEEYILCWNEESDGLYEEFKPTEDSDTVTYYTV